MWATLLVVLASGWPLPMLPPAAASSSVVRGRGSNLLLLLLGMPHLMRDDTLARNRRHVPRPHRRARR